MLMRTAIQTVVRGGTLSEETAAEVAVALIEGRAAPSQIGALLAAIRIRGETPDEIAGFVRILRLRAKPFPFKGDDLIDTCGTGGDRLGTFNVSTAAAFVAAAAGCRVAKHGNGSASSACGSADVLRALGIRPDLSPPRAAHCVNSAGLGFLFAPLFHDALRHLGGIRREIGCSTIFNIVGPLVNPAAPARQLIGVFEKRLTSLVADVLCRGGARHALVVHGDDGADEISLGAPTHICELRDGAIREFTIRPEDFALARCRSSDIAAAGPAASAEIILKVLSGISGPARDVVALNAGAAIYVAGRADSIGHGVRIAADAINRGLALAKLEELKRLSAEADS